MTDRMNDRTNDLTSSDEFSARFERYRDGSMTEGEAVAMETHASGCPRCETLLERMPAISVAQFAPPLPPDVREQTLAAVAQRRSAGVRTRRVRTGWGGAAMMLAAAALLFIVVRPTSDTAPQDGADSTRVSAAEARPAGAAPANTKLATPNIAGIDSTGLASARAQAEFTALDDAAQELQTALAQSPNDPVLRAFLATVSARRDELTRRVKDASS